MRFRTLISQPVIRHQRYQKVAVSGKLPSMLQTLLKRKKQIFDELYRFTSNQCGECEQSGCACKDSICQHVERVNLQRGVAIRRSNHALRFIGCNGCLVPPHLRETCTLYLCEKAQNKPDFDRERYDKLKRISAKIEWRLMSYEVRTT
jgi:hypothetical protein